MERVANSQGGLLSLDRNPILRAAMKQVIYNHFCAGATEKEISQTRDAIKSMGFSGVVLCFGKEVQITTEQKLLTTGSKQPQSSVEIEYWRDGTLETVNMTKEGDWIGIKLTGAGSEVTNALVSKEELPSTFLEALDSVCERAKLRGCKIWIDAEQQAVQPGIDACTINLMRRYNRDGKVLVYNTLQSYLKASRDKLKYQLALSNQEGWQLAVKLVRGAYMANDQRQKIHDTKEDTDACYEGLISDILQGTNLGFEADQAPQMQLLIAGHNANSVIGAFDLMKGLHGQGTLKVRPDFAQLQGMADVLGCDLIRRCEDFQRQTSELNSDHVPKVFKCLTWGSVHECIQYLYRRMVENGTASDRMRDGLSAHVAELRRRVLG